MTHPWNCTPMASIWGDGSFSPEDKHAWLSSCILAVISLTGNTQTRWHLSFTCASRLPVTWFWCINTKWEESVRMVYFNTPCKNFSSCTVMKCFFLLTYTKERELTVPNSALNKIESLSSFIVENEDKIWTRGHNILITLIVR